MSDEEQIRIKGTLVHNLAKHKAAVSLLQTKLWALHDDLEAASGLLAAFIAHPEAEDPEAAVGKLPDAATVRIVCAELVAESKRYEVLKVQASHLGL